MCETCGCGQGSHEHLHILLAVKGMGSASDGEKLETALNALPGIHAAVDWELGAASLLLHGENDIGTAKTCIRDLGFSL